MWGEVLSPYRVGHSTNDAHGQQQGKHGQDEPVHFPLHPAALAGRQRGIHHHLRSNQANVNLTTTNKLTCQNHVARASSKCCCRATGSEGLKRNMLDQQLYTAKSTARF